MQITSQMVSKYKKLIDRNCHGEVLEEIAKDLKISYYADAFKYINKIHELEEGLHPDVLAVRERFRQSFKSYLKQNLTEEEFNMIATCV